jgi:hypothetical protein
MFQEGALMDREKTGRVKWKDIEPHIRQIFEEDARRKGRKMDVIFDEAEALKNIPFEIDSLIELFVRMGLL